MPPLENSTLDQDTELTTQNARPLSLAPAETTALVATEDEVPIIPNVDFLGRGYDLLKLDPLSVGMGAGRKDQVMFRFSPDRMQVTPDGRKRFPLGTVFAPGAGGEIGSQSSSLFSSQDYENRFSESFKAEVGLPEIFNFSASTSYKAFRQTSTSQQSMSTYTDFKVVESTLTLASDGKRFSPELRLDQSFGGFAHTVENLPTVDNEQSRKEYQDFILKFGTHFSDRTTFGGRSYQHIEILMEQYSSLVRDEIDVSVEAKATFDITTGAGASTGSEKQEKFQKTTEDRQSDIIFNGGTPNKNLDTWAGTVADAPAPIELSLQPIHELLVPAYFPDVDETDLLTRKNLLRLATEHYLQTEGHASSVVVRYAVTFDRRWWDKDSKSDRDVAIYIPKSAPEGFLPVGQYAQKNYRSAKGRLLMLKNVPENNPENKPAVVHPLSFDFLWKDKGLGGDVKNASFWRMNPPAGYVALGDVLNRGWSTPPDVNDYYCVRADLCEQGEIGDKIWSDSGKADTTVSLWEIFPKQGAAALASDTFYVRPKSRSKPEDAVVWVLKANAT